MPASLTWTDWSLEPTVIVGLAGAIGLYVVAHRRGWLSKTDDVGNWLPSTRWRIWSMAAGIITAGLALASPIDRGGDRFLLSIHMVQHLMLMMVAPPLLLLGICGSHRLGRHNTLVWRAWLWVARPWSSCLIFNTVLLVWHVPALYNATLTVTPLHVVEHITFVVVGLLFWWPIVDPLATGDKVRVSPLEKIAMLVVAGIPPTVLGLIFSVSPHTFYSFYTVAPRLWGMSPAVDQQIAGVVMFGLGNIIYFVAIGVIFLRLLREEAADEDVAGEQSPSIGPSSSVARFGGVP